MSNNNQRHVVKEDVPQMRSVRIQSMAPPMPMPFQRPGMSSKIAPKNQGVTRCSPPSTSAVWKVEQLRPVPSFYKLERTHLVIDDATASEIAARIADILRQESVSATFNNKEAMVEAETYDAVTFTTRLFADEEEKVIVELQRQAGCSYLFHQTAKAVLRAAKGMKQMKRRTFSIPPSVPKCDEEEKESLESGLELAAGLLKKDRLDAHMLAMESLTQLSRCAKCQCLVAKAIVCGPLLETLVSLIESWSLCATDSTLEEVKDEIEEQHCAAMHRLAIAVLANCLNTLEAEGELKSVLEQRREQLCSPSLLMALVDELRRARQRPHDACEAARCLQPLVRNCSECKPRLVDCDCMSAAAIAFDAGACSHANLEKECQLLKMEIANCN